jgi:hypothetical protein
MSYMHIPNLYASKEILQFKRAYAMEKVDGTSAHITSNIKESDIHLSPGGAPTENFRKIFDVPALTAKLKAMNVDIVIYGEAYGGKMQGMSKVYGPDLKFVVFDVMINELFLPVPKAEKVAHDLGLEFVHYREVSTDLAELDAERDADSVQAVRNGMGSGHHREGVVLRPLIEVRMNNEERIMAKHKREEQRETKTPRKVGADPLVLATAQAISDEYVTETRLTHVLDKLPGAGVTDTTKVIAAMIEDVTRESAGEAEITRDAVKAISRATAQMFQARLKHSLRE